MRRVFAGLIEGGSQGESRDCKSAAGDHVPDEVGNVCFGQRKELKRHWPAVN